MTKEFYNIQRQKLMDDAQKLLDESKTAEAQAKMKEVEDLDAKFEEEAKIQANNVSSYTLEIVTNEEVHDENMVVGSCEYGSKKIIYQNNDRQASR